MKLFEESREFLLWTGILSWGESQRAKTYTTISSSFFLGFIGFSCFASFWYFLFEAKTKVETAESFYIGLCLLLYFAWYIICLWCKDNYKSLLFDLEKIIEKSKLFLNLVIVTYYELINKIT